MCRWIHNCWVPDQSVTLLSLMGLRMCGVPPIQRWAAGRGPWAADRRCESACLDSAEISTNYCLVFHLPNGLIFVVRFTAGSRAGLLLRVMAILFQFADEHLYDLWIRYTYMQIWFVFLIAGKTSFQSTENLYPHYSGTRVILFLSYFFLLTIFLHSIPAVVLLNSFCVFLLLTAVERNNLMRLANTIPFTPVSSLGIWRSCFCCFSS